MKYFLLLTVLVFTSKIENDVAINSGENIMGNSSEILLVVKIEEGEYVKKRSSNYIGVSYNEKISKWTAKRRSKTEKKCFNNGGYRDEKTAAHASDTLARKLLANGEQGHKLNFPDDNAEVYPEERKKVSEYIGVFYNEKYKTWSAARWCKNEKRTVNNGYHRDEERAAHASDTLARKLMANGDQNLKLNFPDNSTEVHKKTKSSKYFGVSYNEQYKRWVAQRWSQVEEKKLSNGAYHKDEEAAARASDTLARKIMANDEQNFKLNFPDDTAEVHAKERTNSSKYFGVSYNENYKRWNAQRWSKTQKKRLRNGSYRDEETAARASDTLARKLIANGEQNHKLNYPVDSNEEHPQQQNNKRKRSFDSENNLEKFEEKEKSETAQNILPF